MFTTQVFPAVTNDFLFHILFSISSNLLVYRLFYFSLFSNNEDFQKWKENSCRIPRITMWQLLYSHNLLIEKPKKEWERNVEWKFPKKTTSDSNDLREMISMVMKLFSRQQEILWNKERYGKKGNRVPVTYNHSGWNGLNLISYSIHRNSLAIIL